MLVNPLQYCQSILPHVSRTFAIGINALSGELKKSVLVGYLFCRIIDTIEDDFDLSHPKKEQYIKYFLDCFVNAHEIATFSRVALELNGNSYHVDLVKNTNVVFQVYETLPCNSKTIIRRWVTEMANGMVGFVNRYPNGIRIVTLDEYKKYCYFVAGTVGYFLTELWRDFGNGFDRKILSELNSKAGIFGQALQTINILKDISFDAHKENSIYIPQDLLKAYGSSQESMFGSAFLPKTEAAVRAFFPIVFEDLKVALEYVKMIPKRNVRIRYFCSLPLILAFATLRELKKSTPFVSAQFYEKIKITRKEVKRSIFSAWCSALSNKYLEKTCMQLLKNSD